MANENRRVKESAARAGSRAPSNAHILIPRNCKLVTFCGKWEVRLLMEPRLLIR